MTAAKRVAILQSSYIPWKGYFDIINMVDEFILFDDVQFTRRDWRNRNRIKTAAGLRWLTIPVKAKGRYLQRIDETEISDPTWAQAHWGALAQSYARASFFPAYADQFETLYRGLTSPSLSVINRSLLEAVCEILGIRTRLSWSSDYPTAGSRSARLAGICGASGATTYISGPAARAYIEPEVFGRLGIALEYMDYAGYPEYPQVHPPFEHQVSVLDLLFNVGSAAPRYMKSFGTVSNCQEQPSPADNRSE